MSTSTGFTVAALGDIRMSGYRDAFRASIDEPARFWAEQATAIDWYRPPTQVLDATNPPFYRWFPDGELNTCHNALDRQRRRRPRRPHGVDLRQPGHRDKAQLQLRRAARRGWQGSPACWRGSG